MLGNKHLIICKLFFDVFDIRFKSKACSIGFQNLNAICDFSSRNTI